MPRTPAIPEAEFTRQVIQYARLHGWRCAHFRPGRTKDGWRTPVQGDGKGFPDLFLVRNGRAVAAELKAGRGKLTVEQTQWLAALEASPVETFVWRPEVWAEIERVLGTKEGS